jgi:hypothetical protein
MKNQRNRRLRRPRLFTTLFASLYLLFHFSTASGQDWPDKIRGYKVYNAKVTVTNSTTLPANTGKSDAFVKLTDPVIVNIRFTAATVEIGAEVTATNQSGSVEFVTFRDVTVNGFNVDVEDYKHPFSFKKREPVALPKPARISLRITSLPRVVYSEIFERKGEIAITGTAFVFGRFKRFGVGFKRVVPIKIDLKLRNPLR